MHSAITCGDTLRLTPSSESTSDEPLELDTERLPCFAIRPPAAATTKVAAVETLNKSAPSPPVPARSIRPSASISTGVASERMARAAPTISPIVSPLIRRPTSKPPICASVASPCITDSMTCSISDCLRLRPSTTCAIACWIFIASSWGCGARFSLGLPMTIMCPQPVCLRKF